MLLLKIRVRFQTALFLWSLRLCSTPHFPPCRGPFSCSSCGWSRTHLQRCCGIRCKCSSGRGLALSNSLFGQVESLVLLPRLWFQASCDELPLAQLASGLQFAMQQQMESRVNCSWHFKHNYENFVDLHWLRVRRTFNELSLDFE